MKKITLTLFTIFMVFIVPMIVIANMYPKRYQKKEQKSIEISANSAIDEKKQEEITSEEEAQEISTEEKNDTTDNLAQDVDIQYLLDMEPAIQTELENGTQMRLIPTDKACGSYYYELLGVNDGKCVLYNNNPFEGSGGEAIFMIFEKNEIGFVGLSYSGGCKGCLYRTEDGGKHFEICKIEPVQYKVMDNTTYCPFEIPAKVGQDDEGFYLIMEQGPDGDYYSETFGYCKARYRTTDAGKSWFFQAEVK